MLTARQIDQFRRDGYLTVGNAVTETELADMRREVEAWVEESRAHRAPFGPPTIDGRPRFDMGAEHSSRHPALRRVNNPSDISGVFEPNRCEQMAVPPIILLAWPIASLSQKLLIM